MADERIEIARRRRRAVVTFVAAMIGHILIVPQISVTELPADIMLLGHVGFALAITPLCLWLASGALALPLFESIAIAYYVHYCNPVFIQEHQLLVMSQYIKFDETMLRAAMYWVLLWMVALVVGYVCFSKALRARIRPLDLPLDIVRVRRFAGAAAIFGLAVFAANLLNWVPDTAGVYGVFTRLAVQQLYIGTAMLSFQVYLGAGHRWWLLLLIVAASLLGMASMMLELVLLPALVVIMVRWCMTRRLPITILAAGMAVFVLFNAVKLSVRSMPGGDVMRWLRAASGLAQDLCIPASSGITVDSTVRTAFARFDYLHILVHVMNRCPDPVPRYGGETYKYLIYGLVPRIFWPDKPQAQAANHRVAVDFELSTQSQTQSTMLGVGHLTEAYVNFAWLGFVLTGLAHALFYALLDVLFNTRQNYALLSIYLGTMIFFLNGIGTNTASVAMYGIQNLGASVVILVFFCRSRELAQESAGGVHA